MEKIKNGLGREFFRYVLPSMLAFALSGIYSIADGFFVGNELGDNALTAINVAYPLTAFIQAAGTGIGMGGAVLYTISANSAAPERKDRFFGMAVLLLAAAGVLLTFAVFFASPFFLRLFGAEGQIYDYGEEYMRFIALGALFQVFGTGLTPFIRNMGGTVTAMAAMIAGFVTNIVLDYAFVWLIPWGMTGAAVATVIGQAVTLAVCVGYLLVRRQKPSFRFGGAAGRTAGKTLLLALSPFGLTFSPQFTLIFVNIAAAAAGGDFALNCYAPVSYAISVVLLLLQGVSDGCQPLVSREYGRGKPASARSVRNMAFLFAVGISLVCAVVMFLVRNVISGVFGASAEVSAEVGRILPVFIAGFVFVAFSRIATAFFYATDSSRRAYIIIYGEPVCLLVLLLFLPRLLGVFGVWLAVPLSQAVLALVGALLILLYDRREKKKQSQPENV